MSIEDLPEEILARILSFLPPSDRLESALTCRRWAQAVALPPLLRDVWLVIEERWEKEAESIFVRSRRQYENLRIYEGLSDAFWTTVGPTLRRLKLTGRTNSSEKFYSILQACTNLESLEIRNIRIPLLNSESPSGMNLRRIQESMRHLHHLHVSNLLLDQLEHLLILMPNISSIGLKLHRVEPGFAIGLLKILGTSRRVTTLELTSRLLKDGECEKLLKMSSASLRRLNYYGELPRHREFNALGDCTMILDLDISLPWLEVACPLQNFFRSVPDLESLSITSTSSEVLFTREHLLPILDLKKLRRLHLNLGLVTDSETCIPDEIVHGLARMISLETLELGKGLGIHSSQFRILASLPNLRNLRIHAIKWNVECLRILLFYCRKLRTLHISNPYRYDRAGRLIGVKQGSELERKTPTYVDRFGFDRQEELESSSLEVLTLNSVPITDICIGRIAARHTRLKVVYFSDCGNITDVGLVTLFQHEPLLEELYVCNGKDIIGTFLEALGELPCRRLRLLSIRTRTNISSQVKQTFESRKPRVECRFSHHRF